MNYDDLVKFSKDCAQYISEQDDVMHVTGVQVYTLVEETVFVVTLKNQDPVKVEMSIWHTGDCALRLQNVVTNKYKYVKWTYRMNAKDVLKHIMDFSK
jgi:hypothetical protein